MTTNEELNRKLYDKLQREQDEFVAKLSGMDGKTVLSYAHEYVVRENIRRILRDLKLSDARARAFLLEDTPLEVLYRNFDKVSSDIHSAFEASIQATAEDRVNEVQALPIYRKSYEYAKENGELELFLLCTSMSPAKTPWRMRSGTTTMMTAWTLQRSQKWLNSSVGTGCSTFWATAFSTGLGTKGSVETTRHGQRSCLGPSLMRALW